MFESIVDNTTAQPKIDNNAGYQVSSGNTGTNGNQNYARNRNNGRFQSEVKIDKTSNQGLILTPSRDLDFTLSRVKAAEHFGSVRSPQQHSINQQIQLQQNMNTTSLYNQLQLQQQNGQQQIRNNAGVHHNSTNAAAANQEQINRLHKSQKAHPQSDRMISPSHNVHKLNQQSNYSNGKQSIATYDNGNNTSNSKGLEDPLNEASIISNANNLVSFKRFKNTAGVGLVSNNNTVRRSLNEMTQQFKKTKEIHELMVERKNIENMIVNSKLWSPPFQNGASSNLEAPFSSTTGTMRSTELNQPFTSNVFSDKREELTKILKKRLNYIHQQSSQNQHMLSNLTTTQGGAGSMSKNSPGGFLSTPHRGSAMQPLSSSPMSQGRRTHYNGVMLSPVNTVSNKAALIKHGLNQQSSIDQMQQSFEMLTASGSKDEKMPSSDVNKNLPQKLPNIQQHKSRHNQLVPGKGGNPFMIKNRELQQSNNEKKAAVQQEKPKLQSNNEQSTLPQNIQQQQPAIDVLETHVDAVIADESFKRGLQDQINHSVQMQERMNTTLKDKTKGSIVGLQNSLDNVKQQPSLNLDTHGGSTSMQRQMIYQSDFQMKVGQINKHMDQEFNSLDQALEHLKLKKPHQLGHQFSVVPTPNSPVNAGNPFKHHPKGKSFKANPHHGLDNGSRSDSLNYISIIKSNIDNMAGDLAGGDSFNDINIQDQMQLEQIQNFALKLMRQRMRLDGSSLLNRNDSFNTEMGMAFSAKNDHEDYNNKYSKDDDSDDKSDEDEHGHSSAKLPMSPRAGGKQHTQKIEMVLETERGIKAQEKEFVNKVQDMMINEFQLNGTVSGNLSPRHSEMSLYLIKKKKMSKKSSTADEIPSYVVEYMKNMKTQTLEALTQDVKARNSFFQFIRHLQNPVFGEKFTADPKLNYLIQCNKEFVTALPTVSKIQAKTLNLLGYRLNSGVCKAIRIYLENFRNAITKIALDNNGMTTGDVLAELLQGVKAQEDFKQIVIIRNAVDDSSTNLIVDLLKRSFPKALEELRIINCKISPMSTHKILTSINDGSSSLRKLSLAGAQISEQSLGLLASIIAHVRSLMDLDISWNGLRPNANMKKFLEAIGGNRSLQYLNLSWNNLMLPPTIHKDPPQQQQQPGGGQNSAQGGSTTNAQQPTSESRLEGQSPTTDLNQTQNGISTKKHGHHEKLDDYTQHLLDNLLRFIKYNKHLIHLDLSYTRLDEMMITALGTALRRAKSLVGVHFTGNPGVTQEVTEYLHQRVHCKSHKDIHTKKESQCLIQTIQSQSPSQNKAFDGVQLKQILQRQKIIKNTTGGQSFKPEIEEGNYLQFQRQLGHKFEIPRSGQWQMNSAWQDIRDPCWVCSKWCYTLIYWSPSVQLNITRTLKLNRMQEEDELELVKPLLRQTGQPSAGGVPKIAGSFTNWEVKEMTPLITFCEAIDANKPDPFQILKKQGRIRDECETEDDLKTDKEKMHFQRVKDQIKQEYKLKWKASILKSLKYKKACHMNLDFATEVDLRHEEIYVFASFGYPGQHIYYVQDPTTGSEFINKCIVPLREEDVPIYEKINKFKIQQRVFKKDASVFKEWKEDTPVLLQTMFNDDIKWWKVARFIKDDTDRERVEKLLSRNFQRIKKIFTSFIAQSCFPNISWIDFGNFCEKCKIIDGKGVTLATVDRAFIAANVAVEGQKLSEDNPTNALSRFEFLEILVRLAQSKFKETGICSTYEESMQKLLDEHIFPNAHPDPWQEFRDELLWTIDVNDVLEVNLEGLKKVYTNYHEPRKKFMTMTDALSLMMKDTTLGLIEKDAIYCFGMCKMSVIYEQENMWQYKQLKFVELLELVGRIAHQKFKDHPELHESLSLAQKIEHVLDVVFKLVDVTRKDVQNNVVEESESDDDY